MEKTRKLVLFGDSAFAEIAYEYFTHDSPYEVVAFAVEAEYRTRDELFGLPVVPFESLADRYHWSPARHIRSVSAEALQAPLVAAPEARA